jgi:hypothetical protein
LTSLRPWFVSQEGESSEKGVKGSSRQIYKISNVKTPNPIDVLIRRMDHCEIERARLSAKSWLHGNDKDQLHEIQRRRTRLLVRKLRLAKSAVSIARISEANRLTREAC